jgi:ABC-type spermidine/putrescine transport system permease subunit I
MYGPLLVAVLLSPFLALLLLGFLLPLGHAVSGSLTTGQRLGSEYAAVAHSAVFWLVLQRTFVTSALVSLICLLVAYPTAEFISLASRRLQPLLLALVVVPLWSSTVARTYSWVGMFQRDGIVDRVAALFGAGPRHLLFSRPAVLVGMVHVMLPFLLLPAYAALQRYDQRLTKASLSLGASRTRTLLRVKLPVLAPQLISGGVAVFIVSLGFFITPAVLGGPSSQMISNLIYQQVYTTFDIPRGYAICVILVVLTLVVLGLMALLLNLVRKAVR